MMNNNLQNADSVAGSDQGKEIKDSLFDQNTDMAAVTDGELSDDLAGEAAGGAAAGGVFSANRRYYERTRQQAERTAAPAADATTDIPDEVPNPYFDFGL